MYKTIKLLSVFATVLVTIGLLTACNTMRGFGRDVSAGGRVIQRSAGRAHHPRMASNHHRRAEHHTTARKSVKKKNNRHG